MRLPVKRKPFLHLAPVKIAGKAFKKVIFVKTDVFFALNFITRLWNCTIPYLYLLF